MRIKRASNTAVSKYEIT